MLEEEVQIPSLAEELSQEELEDRISTLHSCGMSDPEEGEIRHRRAISASILPVPNSYNFIQ